MLQIFEYLVDPYMGYEIGDIFLEIVAVVMGLVSVYFAKKDHLWVYPTGMISTAIYVYLLVQAGLVGDVLINAYYFIMSVYGWFYWTQKKEGITVHAIASINQRETLMSVFLFIGSIVGVGLLYVFFDKANDWTAPVDTLTTALFFVGMWLMARRKIQHWIFWIIGDVISVPLYLVKGLGLTSLQYIIFTLIAIFGYREWKKR
ncbi:MAG: nicotinamide riboside transporter PnuC [Bacteroidetes bacterium]|nr:nicotinamide riboside transporter PnuC [Bacteroidota bacterium]MDA0922302.1 nicotinamide riboside transporter PnuC [Bacteroidota bacterium]MDA1288326.1 nicotinamide riboside transporter PnuC [Bacteroidota bacterium]